MSLETLTTETPQIINGINFSKMDEEIPGFTFDPEKHEYWANGRKMPSVTQILREMGVTYPYSDEAAMERGKNVHLACEFWDQGRLDWESVCDEYLPFIKAYVLACGDLALVPIKIEKKVFHQKLFYGGILDRISWVNGEPAIIDIKTGDTMDDATGLQLAGYLAALGIRLPRYGLQLKSNGKYSLKLYDDPREEMLWISAVSLFYWKVNKRKVKI